MTHDRLVRRKHLKEINGCGTTANHNQQQQFNNFAANDNESDLRIMGKMNGSSAASALTSTGKEAAAPEPQVRLQDFEILKVLGKGAYGKGEQQFVFPCGR